jgi:hypothetical protein
MAGDDLILLMPTVVFTPTKVCLQLLLVQHVIILSSSP